MTTHQSGEDIVSAQGAPKATPDDAQSQRERAYEHLRRLVVLQQIPEGERLKELEWVERLGVNRTALREAFARLEAEGLIERGAKSGYFLPVLTDQMIIEIIEVRLVLECGAVDHIVREGFNTLQRLAGMQDACSQLERLVREQYHADVAEVDRRYHESLVRAAENERLTSIYCRAPLPIIHPMVVGGKEWAETVERTVKEHRGILAAILEGDAAGANRLLRSHMLERYLTPLGKVPASSFAL